MIIVVGTGGYFGYLFVSKLMTWRHLDQTYEEQFEPPTKIVSDLKGKKVIFHMKTGLDQDDGQICVRFNVIFASLEAGAGVPINVTLLFSREHYIAAQRYVETRQRDAMRGVLCRMPR
jgi:hypothetical protein